MLLVNSNDESFVLINQTRKVRITEQKTNVLELLKLLGYSSPGIAIAINNQLVTQEQWPDIFLKHDDNINIFGAIAGG